MTEIAAPLKSADAAADRLRTVVGKLSRYLRLAHVDVDLTPSQREVLSAIVRRGPLRLSELASEEGINPTMLSRIVTKLETANLATRTPDPSDARVIHLGASDQGRLLWQKIQRDRTDAMRGALNRLTKDQRRLVVDAIPALEKLIDALRSDNQ
ncbi:MAG: MarR family winged helix-turn-helix transcriptional regulator [Acidimicrobiales bacterium]